MNGKARVWILICLLAVAAIAVVSVPVIVFSGSRQPKLYVGRTRIMVNSAQAPPSAKAAKLTVEDVRCVSEEAGLPRMHDVEIW